MQIVMCTEDKHTSKILEIFNEAILNSTALYDYQPWDAAVMREWFQLKRDKNFPVIGVENEHGELMGFASYGTFRVRPAYKYSVEHSVYVQKDHRGKGLGKVLLQKIVEEAQKNDFHMLIGFIDLANPQSIALHQKLGFQEAGIIRDAGYKFGRWLDVVLYQRILATPETPNEL